MALKQTWRKDPDTGLYRRAWYGDPLRPGYMTQGACEPCCEPGDPTPDCCDLPIDDPDWCGNLPECGDPSGASCCSTSDCARLTTDSVDVEIYFRMVVSGFLCAPGGPVPYPTRECVSQEMLTLDIRSGCTTVSQLCRALNTNAAFSSCSISYTDISDPLGCGGLSVSESAGFSAVVPGFTCRASFWRVSPAGMLTIGSCSGVNAVGIRETNEGRPCPDGTTCWSRLTRTVTARIRVVNNYGPCPGGLSAPITLSSTTSETTGGCSGCGSDVQIATPQQAAKYGRGQE